ncbi:MAG: hypothetical protein OXC01_03860, partial [Immundisolibacterales bacterium]|nr:hypothetical protein [Immundisolibacterales bacterium]
MTTSREQFRQWLEAPEGARLEFKEARHSYHFEKLLQYCVALARMLHEGRDFVFWRVVSLSSERFREVGRRLMARRVGVERGRGAFQ